MRSPTNIARHELIGLDVVVVDANNKSLIGIEGEIVDETKNTFVIQTKIGEKNVLKKGASFKTKINNQEIIIKGDILVGRPEDRIKK
ncbi:MAG: ribonuclease P protein subunit POP4 [archaeon GW2011_AR17]|nr:MAG: ribonuclease P protein subunit POP4 [archaeon GW2011_AR17]MBS3154306.1 ribonuclease P protein subunit [Candidatus Woesearchaeota archaeon]HIH15246.1 ribonuclease P protein subunit [Nanoarchaeota archaeon]HIH58601.1 ribonuclease P protein subunit [Nanoarchaeota archaeon]HII13796.1 ribonuclease P protein subunit [Nanoarchaeota archaeon]